jgi:phosphatidylglycerol---prolipoprotein diacylglyceryl transferase
MLQELFRIPIVNIPVFGYGLMLVIGFYCAMQVGRALARRSGIDPDIVVNIALTALVFGITGSRLSHILENLDEYTRSDLTVWQNLWNAVNIRSGGLTFYGGLLLATAACIAYGVWRRVPLRLTMDIIAPCVMIGLGFGRIGCFLNGCCYGAECGVPWAVHFPYHSNAYQEQFDRGEIHPPADFLTRNANGGTVLKTMQQVKSDPDAATLLRQKAPGVTQSLPVHPSQLYSSFNAFLIAGVLIAFFSMQPPPGRVFALMLMLKGATRFILEMIRAEPAVWGPLSFSMVVSIPLFLAGVVMWYVVGKMDRARPQFGFEPILPPQPAGAAA